jgi:Tfp pilus assembly protein PilF
MFCISCGAKNAAESNFCRQCGLKLDRLPATKISEEAFDRAMPEDEQVTALLELAYRRRKEKDVAGAVGLCKEVLDIRPGSTTAHGLLGQLYEQTGERDKAVEQYEAVLKLNPGSIADRVKLDDLREGRTAPVSRNPIPSFLPVDPNGAPIRSAMIWGVGMVALIILSGAALAIAFNHRTLETDHSNTSTTRTLAAKPVADLGARSAADTHTAAAPDRPADNATPTGSAFGPANYYPTYGIPGAPAMQVTSPPIYIYPQGYGGRQQGAAPAAVAGAGRAARPPVSAERAPSDADTGGVRVHLSESDNGSGGDGRGSDNKGSAQPPAKQGPDVSRIVVIPRAPSPDTNTGAGPTSESATMISVGQDKLNKTDYAGAIAAFVKALNGANDESAYVYEQLGHCYQARNENRNATAMYQKGRDKYRELIAAGKQLDKAAGGLKICENGIKICSSE